MTLVSRCTNDRVASFAYSIFTFILFCAKITIRTNGAIRLFRIGALSGTCVALPLLVALIWHPANNRVFTLADAGFASISLAAGVAIVAGFSVGLSRIRALTRDGIA